MGDERIADLRAQIDELCVSLSTVLRDIVSFQSFSDLRAIAEACKGIQHSAESARALLEVTAVDGSSFSVEVTPADVVQVVKSQIAKASGIPEWKQSLFPTGGASGGQKLAGGQIISAITPLPESLDLVQRDPFSVFPDLICCVACETASTPMLDIVSGKTWTEAKIDDRTGIEDTGGTLQFLTASGRRGVEIMYPHVLRAPEPIKVGDAFTISMWVLFPIRPRQHELGGDGPLEPLLFEIVSGPPPCEGVLVVAEKSLAVGKIDQNTREPSPTDFDLMSLSPGWHHLCEVNSDQESHHYVDGAFVGKCSFEDEADTLRGRPPFFASLKLTLLGVSCRVSHRDGPGRAVVSDVCVFGAAADADQVSMLAASP